MDDESELKEVFGSFDAKRLTARPPPPRTYFFFSVDLVDSTRLKQSELWIDVLWHFFDAVTTYAKGNGFFLWKYRGDEALFFKPLSSLDDVCSCVDLAFSISERLNKDFQHESYFKNFEINGLAITPQVKTTAWCGVVHELSPSKFDEVRRQSKEIAKENFLLRFGDTVSDHGGAVEFLGTNVDMGFRVAEAANPYVLSLSLQLVKLIVGFKGYRKKIRLVGHRLLRGLSDGDEEHYWPVFWYAPKWQELNSIFESMSLPSSYRVFSLAVVDFKKFVGEREVDKLIRRYRLTGEIKRLKKFSTKADMGESTQNASLAEGAMLYDRGQKMHCVAVCFNSHGEALLGQRKRKPGSALSEKWEFGCAQVDLDLGFFESIRRDYLHDFGVEVLEVLEPPVRTFTVDGKGTPGIIFAARISDKAPEKNKHQKVLLSQRDFFVKDTDECVSGFFDTWRLAENIFNEG